MEHKEHNDQKTVTSMVTSVSTRKEWHKPELKILQMSNTLTGAPRPIEGETIAGFMYGPTTGPSS